MAVLLALALSINVGSTAANTVPTTKAQDDSRTVTADDLKPVDCAGITLTAKLSGSGIITGTNADELITGSAGVDDIRGFNGDDCLIGGAGNDSLTGGPGNDVCIGGAGTDTFASCETQIQ